MNDNPRRAHNRGGQIDINQISTEEREHCHSRRELEDRRVLGVGGGVLRVGYLGREQLNTGHKEGTW